MEQLGVQNPGAFELVSQFEIFDPVWGRDELVNRAMSTHPQLRAYQARESAGNAQVRRAWRYGDTVTLDLPMPINPVACHPYVAENVGRVALMRGPLLYCLEGADNPGFDLRDVRLSATASLASEFLPDLLDGVVALRGPAQVVPPEAAWHDHLYRTATAATESPASRSVHLTAVPYYAWANREPGPMRVWLHSEPAPG